MTAYIVYGDIHPSMVVHVDDNEYKTICTKIAIGVPPEDIRLNRKPVNGARELSVYGGINVQGKGDFIIVSKGNYLHLELDESDDGVIPF